jgi:phenylalanyl-tRNA synthetase beta chain
MMRQVLKSRPESALDLLRVKHHLVSLGYQEVVTYSFIDPALSAKVNSEVRQPIALQNPISAEMSVMRPSLLPGLLHTLKYNVNRQQEHMRLFESGLVFTAEPGNLQQTARLGGLIYGRKNPNNWSNNKELYDFYDLKGDVESMLALGGKEGTYTFVAGQHPSFHPGQCAAVFVDEQQAGYMGALHPAIQRELGLDRTAYLFDLSLDAVLQAKLAKAVELSRFPEVYRDLAVVIDEKITSDKIQALICQNAGEFLTSLRIFDVYQGDAVAKNKKSIALGLTWQHPSRTLSDDDINAIISSCVNALQEQFNADLRT